MIGYVDTISDRTTSGTHSIRPPSASPLQSCTVLFSELSVVGWDRHGHGSNSVTALTIAVPAVAVAVLLSKSLLHEFVNHCPICLNGCSVQDGIYALGKAYNYALHPVSLRSFLNVAFETVPMFV